MEIKHIGSTGSVAQFKLIGALNTLEAPLLLDAVLPETKGARGIILDCSDMPYVTSMGLRAFVSITKALKAEDGKLVISGLTGLARDIFIGAGLPQIISVVENVEEAKKLLETSQ